MPQRNKKGQFIGQPKEGDKQCPICLKQFHYIRASSNPPPKTCSKECRYKSTAISEYRKITRLCIVCNKPFEIPPAWLRKQRGRAGTYCSRECRYKNKFQYTKKEKIKAVNRLRWAVKTGKVIQQSCIICNELKSQAHHHKGYAEENWLNVVWLCSKHHLQEHERLRGTGLNTIL